MEITKYPFSYAKSRNHLCLPVRVKPSSKTCRINNVLDTHVDVSIDARPHQGEANVSLLRFIAQAKNKHTYGRICTILLLSTRMHT